MTMYLGMYDFMSLSTHAHMHTYSLTHLLRHACVSTHAPDWDGRWCCSDEMVREEKYFLLCFQRRIVVDDLVFWVGVQNVRP